MPRSSPHFSRPIYEGLPWIYIIGLACVVGGFVVLLRRRDYRALRSQYADPDSLNGDDER